MVAAKMTSMVKRRLKTLLKDSLVRVFFGIPLNFRRFLGVVNLPQKGSANDIFGKNGNYFLDSLQKSYIFEKEGAVNLGRRCLIRFIAGAKPLPFRFYCS